MIKSKGAHYKLRLKHKLEFRTFILLFILRQQRVAVFRSAVVLNWVEYVKYKQLQSVISKMPFSILILVLN